MKFLNKLYESNYFGIGLFAVIAFLVLLFLIVLFFGKRDEKNRKLEEMNRINRDDQDAFEETTQEKPVEIPYETVREVTPISLEETPQVTSVSESYSEPVQKPVWSKPEEVMPPVYEENYNAGIIRETPIKSFVEPVNVGPVRFDTLTNNEPKVMDSTRIDATRTYEEPVVRPVIEEVKPVIAPTYQQVKPVIEEAPVQSTYYQPQEEIKAEEVQVPNIDFDAIAKSISQELDELERSNAKARAEVEVTPIKEITNGNSNQFSSVYVNDNAKPHNEAMDLPKRIDLPTRKEEIEPESYNI